MNGSPDRRLLAASLAACALMAAACGSNARTPTAAATPAPVATPTPAPAATPQAFTCHLPAMVDLHNHCPKLDSRLLAYVNKAIDTVQQKRPELFDFNEQFNIWTSAGYTRRSYITTCFPAQF